MLVVPLPWEGVTLIVNTRCRPLLHYQVTGGWVGSDRGRSDPGAAWTAECNHRSSCPERYSRAYEPLVRAAGPGDGMTCGRSDGRVQGNTKRDLVELRIYFASGRLV